LNTLTNFTLISMDFSLVLILFIHCLKLCPIVLFFSVKLFSQIFVLFFD